MAEKTEPNPPPTALHPHPDTLPEEMEICDDTTALSWDILDHRVNPINPTEKEFLCSPKSSNALPTWRSPSEINNPIEIVQFLKDVTSSAQTPASNIAAVVVGDPMVTITLPLRGGGRRP